MPSALDTHIVVLIVIVVVVILFCMLSAVLTKFHTEQLMGGMWHVNRNFADQAQLINYVFHISNDRKHGYIVAANSTGVFLNAEISLRLSCKTNQFFTEFMYKIPDMVEYDVEFDYMCLSDDEIPYYEEMFPRKQQLAFYPGIGKIILHVDGTVTAIFNKDESSIVSGILPKELITEDSE